MENTTKQLPAHYLDHRTQQMLNDANADIAFHAKYSEKAMWNQPQVEKELDLYHRQLEALDQPIADNLTIDEKKALRNYYKNQIRQRTERLYILVKAEEHTATASNCNVEFEIVA